MPQQETSVSTSRNAYAETRRWLLAHYGPTCAYCGRTFKPLSITLDHVTPRRGQSAYDRRDNLVLACKGCNGAKADKPFLVFLLARRERATFIVRYGAHLSDGLLGLAKHIMGEEQPFEMPLGTNGAAPPEPRVVYGDQDDGEESPYYESPYRD